MDTQFDPYREWLHVAGSRRPPTHYELLGLPTFDADGDRVRQATMDRTVLVRRFQSGRHSDVAIRILGELSQAMVCLTDERQKEQYDRLLGARPHEVDGSNDLDKSQQVNDGRNTGGTYDATSQRPSNSLVEQASTDDRLSSVHKRSAITEPHQVTTDARGVDQEATKHVGRQSEVSRIHGVPIRLKRLLYATAVILPLGIVAYLGASSRSAADRANKQQIADRAAQQESDRKMAAAKAADEAAKAAAREASKKAAAERIPVATTPASANTAPSDPGTENPANLATATAPKAPDPNLPDPKPTSTAAATQTPSNAEPAATESTVSFTYVKPPPPVADADGAAEVVDLVKWQDPPKPNWQLVYHAPATASKLLDIQSEGQDVTLSIKAGVIGGNQAGPPGRLCRLYLADSCLRFQWLAKVPIDTAALGCIEGGVLKIHAGDDKWSQYIAFYEQVHLNELPLKDGSAVIKSPDGKPIPFKQPTFFLGDGKLHMYDGSEVKFETPKNNSQSGNLADPLRERMDAAGIHVRLVRLAGSPGHWQLKVEITPKVTAGTLRNELESMKSMQSLIGKHLSIIQDQNLKTTQIAIKVSAAKALAEILKLSYPNEPTDQPPIDKKGRDELKRYSDEVMDNIAKPAQAKQRELAKEIRELSGDLKKLEGDTKQEEKRLTNSIKSISAVLYHLIDGNTRIDDVVIGAP